jgi:hypothetical protein
MRSTKREKRASEDLFRKLLDTTMDAGYIRPIPTDESDSNASVKDFLEPAQFIAKGDAPVSQEL